MALKKCSECKQKISSKALSCPQCGSPQKKKSFGCGSSILIILFAIGFFVWVFQSNQNGNPKTQPDRSANNTTQQPKASPADTAKIPEDKPVVKRTVTELRLEAAYSEAEAENAEQLLKSEEGVEVEIVEPQPTEKLKRLLAKMDRKLAKRQTAGYESWKSDVEKLTGDGGSLSDAAQTLLQLAMAYRLSDGQNSRETVQLRNLLMEKIDSTEKGMIRIWGQREISETEHLQMELARKQSAFVEVLTSAGLDKTTIESVSVEGDTATITVSNLWHQISYQIRFQAAQKLWEHWWKINRAKMADLSRINIVDYNGNSVGGSRVWGGSFIWVKDD